MNSLKENKNFIKRLKKVLRSDRSAEKIIRDNDVFKCPECEKENTRKELKKTMFVCPECKHHYRISARHRIKITFDAGSFREISRGMVNGNPLGFPAYEDKLAEAAARTNMKEAVITGTGEIGGIKAVAAVMDSRFMMASMGMAVGEKITRACEYATKKRLPLIIFSTSGGARMQEGILSLFQMAKTNAAISRHSEAGLLYISIMTNPTTGGVTASFASIGDIIISEPGALIGFAGPRVIEQTIRQELPEGFQRAEFLKEHGFLDMVVERKDMRDMLSRIMELHRGGYIK